MARIFLSHSSLNNPEAIALRNWLVAEGWDDLFLDLDPERGIVAGERWERALYEAASRCDAVLFLVSRAWLDSAWCRNEFHMAHRLGKRIIGILIEDNPIIQELPAELTATWQLVNLASGSDHKPFRVVLPDGKEQHVTFSQSGLTRLKNGLNKAGLDPRFFAWPPEHDPKRPPYRGMRPLEAEDAGIFFGREAPLIDLLATLRGLRETAPPRFLVILGASGAGKSSFLRAGILPRLQRDDWNFLPLPIIRPEKAVITGDNGLLNCLVKAFDHCGIPIARKSLSEALTVGEAKLLPLLGQLVEQAKPPLTTGEHAPQVPTLVLSIDQGEELFLAEGKPEAQPFLTLLRDLVLANTPNLLILITIRSDSYERLQTEKILDGVGQKTYSLPPMPSGAYQTVIEGPAARLVSTQRTLKIDPKLTETLLQDIDRGGGKDTLPLLAFTLERLYIEYGGEGELRLKQYLQMEGIKGAIEAAVERAFKAAAQDPALPRDRTALELLLRRGLIPWLAGIDLDTKAPRRRVAKLVEIPAEARPLIDHLIEQRLLATDEDQKTGEKTIEPVHESLLRQWGLLQGWLQADIANLAILEGVQRGSRDWEANQRDHAWLNHTAGRLEDAERLKQRDDLARFLTRSNWEYLQACRERDNQHRDKELEEARKLEEAHQKVMQYLRQAQISQSHFFAEKALAAQAQNQSDLALNLVLIALPQSLANPDRPLVPEAVNALTEIRTDDHTRVVLRGHEDRVNSAVFSPDGRRAISTSNDNTARLWDAQNGAELVILRGHEFEVTSAEFSPNGARAVTASVDWTARLWDATSGAELCVLRGHRGLVSSAVFSPDGMRVVTTSLDGTAWLWDAQSGTILAILFGHTDWLFSAVFSPDGVKVVTASRDRTARLWHVESGAELSVLRGHENAVHSAAFSPDGARVVTASWDTTTRLWDATSGTELAVLRGHENAVNSAVFSPDGTRVVTASDDKTARLWDATSGAELAVLRGHGDQVNSAVFSPDGTRVITASYDNTARLWDAKSGTELAILRGHKNAVNSAVFSPDGTQVLSASGDMTARLCDVGSVAEIAILHHMCQGSSEMVGSAVFSPDGTQLLMASNDKTARLWDATSGAELAVLRGHEDQVNSAVFSPDGTRIVTASDDKTARLWDTKNQNEVVMLRGHEDCVNSAVFSPDGEQVVTASTDKTARRWNVQGKQLVVLRGHEDRVKFAVFSPDGARVLTVAWDQTARLWDAQSETELAVLHADCHKDHPAVCGRSPSVSIREIYDAEFSPDGTRIVTVALYPQLWDAQNGVKLAALCEYKMDAASSAVFSPDGTMMVTASHDKTARLWNSQSGEQLSIFCGHRDRVNSAAFSPDGMWVVTASDDKTARLWDVKYGSQIVILRGHIAGVNSAMFSPDGTRVVTVSTDVRLWGIVSSLSLPNLLLAARASAFRPLSKEDRDRNFIYDKNRDQQPHHQDLAAAQALKLWQGDGVSQDRQAALNLWRQAAERGDPWSHRKLGWLYELGREGVVPQDLAMALFHYAIATRIFEQAEMEKETADTMARRGSLARTQPMDVTARTWEAAMAWQPAMTR